MNGPKRDTNVAKRDRRGVTASRARKTPTGSLSRPPGRDIGSDSDSQPRGLSVTITANVTTGLVGVENKNNLAPPPKSHKEKLAADPRFALWAAIPPAAEFHQQADMKDIQRDSEEG